MRNNVWKDVGTGGSDETAGALALERDIMFACSTCGFIVSNQYAGRAHEAHGDTDAMQPGMGCASRQCIRQRKQYRRKHFMRTQHSRVARLETGVALLIAPPVTRRPDTRAVLADVDMRSAIGHVKLLLLEM